MVAARIHALPTLLPLDFSCVRRLPSRHFSNSVLARLPIVQLSCPVPRRHVFFSVSNHRNRHEVCWPKPDMIERHRPQWYTSDCLPYVSPVRPPARQPARLYRQQKRLRCHNDRLSATMRSLSLSAWWTAGTGGPRWRYPGSVPRSRWLRRKYRPWCWWSLSVWRSEL